MEIIPISALLVFVCMIGFGYVMGRQDIKDAFKELEKTNKSLKAIIMDNEVVIAALKKLKGLD